MKPVPSTIEAAPGHHRLRVKAAADQLRGVEGSHQGGPTEGARAAGRLVLGVRRAIWRGRRPWSRVAACRAPHETAWRWGQAVAPAAWEEATGGRVGDRRYDPGPRPVWTAGAV